MGKTERNIIEQIKVLLEPEAFGSHNVGIGVYVRSNFNSAAGILPNKGDMHVYFRAGQGTFYRYDLVEHEADKIRALLKSGDAIIEEDETNLDPLPLAKRIRLVEFASPSPQSP